MKANLAIVSIGYLLTVGVTLSWVFLSRQKRVPRSLRTAVRVSIRTAPLFLFLFVVCRRSGLNASVIVAFLAMILWALLISAGNSWMGAGGVLYVIQ
ncbi:MAG TPA: hypothetical protein VLI39_12375 [Sedimentisphaerales bacterium]|nr:hypothetical protein [Sedimentisphaerales bacterium]